MKKGQNSPKKTNPSTTRRKTATKAEDEQQEVSASAMPLMSETIASTTATRTRSNKSSRINQLHRFENIDKGVVPFNYSTTGYGNKTSHIDIRDTVMLCQKAYYNFAVFRNAIDMMSEFSCSDVYLTGGSKKSRDFFRALFDKINVWNLQDKFFREYYRSGNVFVYRFDSKIRKSDLNKMTQTFGLAAANQKYVIPLRYTILNPADIQTGGNISFNASVYYKVMNGYELSRLRNPQTDEDKEVLKSLPEETRE